MGIVMVVACARKVCG